MLKHTLVAGAAVVALMGIVTPGTAMASPAPAHVSVPALEMPANVNLPANLGLPADGSTADASKALRTEVSKDLSKNQYPLNGGGFVNGSDVLKSDGTLNDAIYSQLSKDGQNKLVKDLTTSAKKYSDPTAPDYNPKLAKSSGVDPKTMSDWFSDLRTSSGIGSAMLTEILKDNVFADLSTGSAWFKPFSGPLSGVLGFFAILVVGLLGVRSVVDLTYISIPYFQSAVDRVGQGGGGGSASGGSGGSGIKWVSNAATQAVQDGESGKSPIFAYFKKAALEYFVLAFALLFLCFNYLWELIGGILNLGTGFLGF